MEVSSVDPVITEDSKDIHVRKFDVESSDYVNELNLSRSMNALEICRETVRVLRYNLSSFMLTAALLICPVSAVALPNVFVNESLVKSLTVRMILVTKSSGFPLRPFIKQFLHSFSKTAVSSATCFPLSITLSLLAKSAVVYAVDCTYSRKKADMNAFFAMVREIWKQLLVTYLWLCVVIAGSVTTFCVLLITICSGFSVLGFSPDINIYAAIVAGLGFSVVFANALVISNVAVVVSILEDVSGLRALFWAAQLIQGRIQVGLSIFLISAAGMAIVEGLFDHRVNTVSYGDGSSRYWEGPLLVVMYSFVVLIDSMMTAVFYFSCRSCSAEAADSECKPILDDM